MSAAPWTDVSQREALAAKVRELLERDDRVDTVAFFGSLATGKSDEFSDIDLVAKLRPGIVDRDFFADLPLVVADVGPSVAGWSFQALSTGSYGGSFLFDEYPLFWEVDIACISTDPTDPTDLLQTYRWEQIYKVWLSAVKAVARAQARVDYVEGLVARHQPVAPTPAHNGTTRLRALLDAIRLRKVEKGDPYQRLHERCEELLDLLSQM
ncbi:MAG TPA: nucleotidyltransferase domain-containing protein [Acidimicrobiales bacterium]|nr:nucleotidyltransferase domain-containing protein [Acidimicrobiales bacterium]